MTCPEQWAHSFEFNGYTVKHTVDQKKSTAKMAPPFLAAKKGGVPGT